MKKLRWPLASPRRVAKLFVVGFPPLLACRAKVRESMICQDPVGSLHIQRTSFVMFRPQQSHRRRDIIRLTMTSILSPAHSGKTPSALVVLSPVLAAVAGSNESPFTFLSNVSNAGNEDENEDENSDNHCICVGPHLDQCVALLSNSCTVGVRVFRCYLLGHHLLSSDVIDVVH